MNRDYGLVSPSLDGVLSHDALLYEGISRPMEVLRFFDGPKSKGRKKDDIEDDVPNFTENNRKLLEEYFHDLYGVFMKKFSYFLVEVEIPLDETVKLQAMLQEMIKVKRWLGGTTK